MLGVTLRLRLEATTVVVPHFQVRKSSQPLFFAARGPSGLYGVEVLMWPAHWTFQVDLL